MIMLRMAEFQDLNMVNSKCKEMIQFYIREWRVGLKVVESGTWAGQQLRAA